MNFSINVENKKWVSQAFDLNFYVTKTCADGSVVAQQWLRNRECICETQCITAITA